MDSSNFSLRQSIEKYVALVNQQGSLTSSDVAELSAHLYDAADDLQQSGLTEEEAFIIACKRLGNEQVLDQEYSKVNTSVKTNKIWAYLLLGFNLFYCIPSICYFLLSVLYVVVYKKTGVTGGSIALITSVHLLICAALIRIVKYKNSLSGYIETQVQKNGALITCLSFILLFIVYLLNYIRVFRNAVSGYYLSSYLSYKFNSDLISSSYYLIFLTMAGAALALIFSIDKHERLSLKTLFEKPSILFLILSGTFTEVFASMTRQIPTENILLKAIAFGMVYLLASYLITFYNKQKSINYLLKFSVFGMCAESIAGTLADIERGNTYFTVYFVLAMLIAILLGRTIALKTSAQTQSTAA